MGASGPDFAVSELSEQGTKCAWTATRRARRHQRLRQVQPRIVDPASRFTLKVRLVFGFLFGRPSTMADSISQNVEASNLST